MLPAFSLLRDVVKGRSFAEVGGLYKGAPALPPAWLFGAKSLAMIDVCAPGTAPWRRLERMARVLGAPAYAAHSADVVAFASRPRAPRFDVVFCAGVLYHHPRPKALLAALRRLARRRVILSTFTAPPGFDHVDLRRAGRGERTAVRAWLGPRIARDALKPRRPWGDDPSYENWYALHSPKRLAALARQAGFEAEASAEWARGRGLALRLRPLRRRAAGPAPAC